MFLVTIFLVGGWFVAMHSDNPCDPRASGVVCAESRPLAHHPITRENLDAPGARVQRFGVDFGAIKTGPFDPAMARCATAPEALVGELCGGRP